MISFEVDYDPGEIRTGRFQNVFVGCRCYTIVIGPTVLVFLHLRKTDGHTRYETHISMILVSNQIDAQFFVYIYFCSLHVSGSHVPIIRRIIVSMRHLVYSTLRRWPSGIILVNKKLDAQFFMYVYVYSLLVSRSHVPIIRRVIVSMRHLLYATLRIWPSGMQEHMLLHTRRPSTQSDIK